MRGWLNFNRCAKRYPCLDNRASRCSVYLSSGRASSFDYSIAFMKVVIDIRVLSQVHAGLATPGDLNVMDDLCAYTSVTNSSVANSINPYAAYENRSFFVTLLKKVVTASEAATRSSNFNSVECAWLCRVVGRRPKSADPKQSSPGHAVRQADGTFSGGNMCTHPEICTWVYSRLRAACGCNKRHRVPQPCLQVKTKGVAKSDCLLTTGVCKSEDGLRSDRHRSSQNG